MSRRGRAALFAVALLAVATGVTAGTLRRPAPGGVESEHLIAGLVHPATVAAVVADPARAAPDRATVNPGRLLALAAAGLAALTLGWRRRTAVDPPDQPVVDRLRHSVNRRAPPRVCLSA